MYTDLNITKQDVDNFYDRTNKHIKRVIDNASIISNSISDSFLSEYSEYNDIGIRGFMSNVLNHDKSKFSDELRNDYIKINSYYRIRRELEADEEFLKKKVKIKNYLPDISDTSKSWQKHCMIESHHPEHHVSIEDRFNYPITPASMGMWDIAEMVCDWAAMELELSKETKIDVMPFYNKVAKNKFKFSDIQLKWITEFNNILLQDFNKR
jgi:hypothetical protein